MKILIAIGVSRQKEAGAAGVVLNHAAELGKRGHQVECWFLEDVLPRVGGWKRFEALRFAREIAKRIRREPQRFDVVNLHAPWGGVYGAWLRRNAGGGPPYVLTMQGSEERYVSTMRVEERRGRAWNFKWRNRVWHRLYHQRMYDQSIRTAEYGMVANREAWILAELKYGKPPGRFWHVPNGTEERFFVAREYTKKTKLDLLFVGSWLDRKGIYYLADAFELMIRENLGVRLTIAGCGAEPEEVRGFFSQEAGKYVRVIPFVKREEIVELYTAHDAFVFPSLIEGMPLTLLEAMATGMPVVTTNTCGMADVVEDEVNGLLVPAASAERLKEAVERLCGSAELREQLGAAGQETMRRYTWERVAEKVESVFALVTSRDA